MNIIDIPEERLPHDSDIMPIVVWCNEHCGIIGRMWQGHYDETDRVFRFYFQQEQDAVLFALRWS